MILKKWNDLPDFMKTSEVFPYYKELSHKNKQLFIKRCFDLTAGLLLLLLTLFPMIIISVAIKVESPGKIFYRQERLTQYGKVFKIHKFRTMISDADKVGTSITVGDDNRITKIGGFLRKYRLDELPQLIDVIKGDMTFVGTRPETVKYFRDYRPEYLATLLLPAGITSETSIRFKNESEILGKSIDPEMTYLTEVLPDKMEINLSSLRNFNLLSDIKTMLRTISSVFGDN